MESLLLSSHGPQHHHIQVSLPASEPLSCPSPAQAWGALRVPSPDPGTYCVCVLGGGGEGAPDENRAWGWAELRAIFPVRADPGSGACSWPPVSPVASSAPYGGPRWVGGGCQQRT